MIWYDQPYISFLVAKLKKETDNATPVLYIII